MNIYHHWKRMAHSVDERLKGRTKWLTLVASGFFVLMAQLYARDAKAQSLTIRADRQPLETVLKEVKKQSGYDVLYNPKVLSRQADPVTVNIIKASLQAALREIFKGQTKLEYLIDQKSILVKAKNITKQADPDQQETVKGHVTDSLGNPLAGVTVSVEGTGLKTITDQKGYYELSGARKGTEIRFTSIGYKPAISVVNRDRIDIVLSAQQSIIDEAIVMGYGTTSKRYSTGSIDKISAEDIERQPVSNPLATLAGRIPGLFITQQNGLPGSNFSVMIRGRNSIAQGNAPIYLIDGVPYGNENLAQNSMIFANSPFNAINPADIESIEVLKDADATAIYGSRGANGVILITTKKAKSSQTSLESNVYQGWGTVTKTMEMMNTEEYLAMRRRAFENDKVEPTESNAYDLLVWNNERNRDWTKFVVGNTAKTTNAQIKLNMGTESTRISWSNNYYKETTVLPTDNGLKRFNTTLSASHKSQKDIFLVDLLANYSKEDNKLIRQNSIMNNSFLQPNAPDPISENGDLNFREGGFKFANPLAVFRQGYDAITDRLTLHANPQYKITSSLKAKLDIGYNLMLYDEYSSVPIASQDPADNPTGSATKANSSLNTLIAEPQLLFNKVINKNHSIDAIIGATWQKSDIEKGRINGNGYTNDDFLRFMSTAVAANITTTNSIEKYRYQAIFARANYKYKNRYILNGALRRDGSSRFGKKQQYAIFGSIGGAWIFSEEQFMQSLRPVLSFGKIRGTYGVTGNDQIGNYQYLDIWNSPLRSYLGQLTLEPTRLPNPYYAWETNRKFNIAADLGFFNEKLLLTAEYYRNISDNQLLHNQLPTQTGFYSILENFAGKVENTGLELSINTNQINKPDFSWSTSLNLTIPRNKLLAFPGLESSNFVNTLVIGEPLSIQKGLVYKGIDPLKGIYTFEDKDGDGVFTNKDYVIIGYTDPKMYGGFQNNIRYKGITLDFLFQFVKQTGRHPIYSKGLSAGMIENAPKKLVSNSWEKEGDISQFQKYSQAYGEAFDAAFYASISELAFTNTTYIRLKNLSLSLAIPKQIVNKMKMKNWDVYFQAQNLLTISPLDSDPEVQSSVSLPPLRMITIGTKINF
ncbi:SusC/RagA family TonB-linked outer membrane protein [Sphingobacterium sp.]|uniref:SusC/RagA family TonB-linked outer membrane protein n=1 Tax=Sphingobacterium sp. TaxID=341027 RepID=UPI00289955BB|nr:SusC/RagA family TonB-linked outer membrane protein [Sphingobacterium sp.]